MTEQEAIKDLEISCKCLKEAIDSKFAVNAYELKPRLEVFELSVKALEKQIPKKPKLVTRADGIIKFYPCPCCSTSEKYISVYPKQKYCTECGQKLDWNLDS